MLSACLVGVGLDGVDFFSVIRFFSAVLVLDSVRRSLVDLRSMVTISSPADLVFRMVIP
jgi:hypothetical protein